jgi:hypothetical protein
MGLGKAQSAGSQLINIWRSHFSGAIATEVAITEVIGINDNDIGAREVLPYACFGQKDQCRGKAKQREQLQTHKCTLNEIQ